MEGGVSMSIWYGILSAVIYIICTIVCIIVIPHINGTAGKDKHPGPNKFSDYGE